MWERARRYAIAALAVWSGSCLVYYAHQEARRRREIQRRARRHRVELAACDGQGRAALEADRARFASLVIGGRFQNPFREWREQGAWEWYDRRYCRTSVERPTGSCTSCSTSPSSAICSRSGACALAHALRRFLRPNRLGPICSTPTTRMRSPAPGSVRAPACSSSAAPKCSWTLSSRRSSRRRSALGA